MCKSGVKEVLVLNAYYCGNYVVLKGTEYEDEMHRHLMKHILIGLEEDTHCIVAGREIYCKGILIQSNVEHKIYKSNKEMLLFLIPDCCNLGRDMETRYFKENTYYILPDDVIKGLCKEWQKSILSVENKQDYFIIFQSLLRCIPIDLNKKYIRDIRVLKSMAYILKNIEKEKLSLKEIALYASISSSRLSHLFKEETGVTIKNYVLLCRILKAIELIMQRKNITQACMQAGFSSSSHFADTVKKWFGLSAKRSMNYMKEKIFSI